MSKSKLTHKHSYAKRRDMHSQAERGNEGLMLSLAGGRLCIEDTSWRVGKPALLPAENLYRFASIQRQLTTFSTRSKGR
jgi:hypothetical protein